MTQRRPRRTPQGKFPRGVHRLLVRKALRDLRVLRGQMVAIVVVIALGVMTFVSFHGMVGHLETSQAAYYARARFADAFATVTRAPLDLLEPVRRLPGVSAVEGRVVATAVLAVPGLAEPATAQFVSIPDAGMPRLNALELRAGRWPDVMQRGEVLASEAFVMANGLRVGDEVQAVLNGRAESLRIVGVALSPEFIYEIPAGGSVFPDNRRFGVFWMPYGPLADAFDLRGSFTDLTVAFAPGADAREILPAIDRILAPYGALGAFGREDQPSHKLLSNEIAQVRSSAIAVPAVFLGVAAYLLALTLGRIVSLQREQLGALKAFGFTTGEILSHMLVFALVPTIVGIVIGTGTGVWLAQWFADLYAEFFRIPLAEYRPTFTTLALGGVVALVAAVAGAWRAVARAARLQPAEAMRPEPPPVFRHGVVERSAVVQRAPIAVRIVVRGLERRPGRTIGAIFGLGLAVSVGMMGRWAFDAVDVLARYQFQQVQREDVEITFRQPVPLHALRSLLHLPGVLHVEPMRAVPVRLANDQYTERTAILGSLPGGTLRRVLDVDGRAIALPTSGVLLSRMLADRLGVRAGDSLRTERLDGLGITRPLHVTGTVDDLMGLGVYAPLSTVTTWLGEEPVATGALLRTDAVDVTTLYGELARLPAVSGVAVRSATVAAFEETITGSFAITNAVFVLFATAIAAGIVYNGARLSLSERGRELASLRVLGFTAAEAGRILMGEQVVLTLVALPVGIGLGVVLTAALAQALSTDLLRLPMIISQSGVAWSTATVLVVAFVSAWRVQRRVHRLDLVAVLKTRE